MSSHKTITYLFLIGVLFTCNVLSQRITIPLKKGLNDSIFFTAKYGSGQCEVNMTPNIEYCSNIINQKVLIPDQCGSEYIGENEITQGPDYKASFQLGDAEANLLFTVPNSNSNFRYSQSLCFGFQTFENERNALLELLEENKIVQTITFFQLTNNSVSSSFGSVIGSLTIGEPDQSLVKKGTEFVYLQSSQGFLSFTAIANSDVKIFDRTIEVQGIVLIDLNSPFTVLDSFGYRALLKLFTEQNIAYKIVGQGNQNQLVYLESIEKLEPLIFTFIQENNTNFEVILNPSQYTKKLADGTYLLLIKIMYYTTYITIGNTILESNYVGFDIARQQILIAHKQPAQNNNFRGALSI